jgi:hypothetical protein
MSLPAVPHDSTAQEDLDRGNAAGGPTLAEANRGPVDGGAPSGVVGSVTGSGEHSQTNPGTDPQPRPGSTQHGKFEEKLKLFRMELAEVAKRHDLPLLIAIGWDPQAPKESLVFSLGDVFKLARLLAQTLRRMKAHIFQELDA